MAGILAPLVIGELVKGPDKKWRYIRSRDLWYSGLA
jgi:hypothetical protein